MGGLAADHSKEARIMEMWLKDVEGRELLFAADFPTEEVARTFWKKIAGVGVCTTLRGFRVTIGERTVYEGDYMTDEC